MLSLLNGNSLDMYASQPSYQEKNIGCKNIYLLQSAFGDIFFPVPQRNVDTISNHVHLETFHLEFLFPLFDFCAKAWSFLFHVAPQWSMQPSHEPRAAKPALGERGGVLAASCHSC